MSNTIFGLKDTYKEVPEANIKNVPKSNTENNKPLIQSKDNLLKIRLICPQMYEDLLKYKPSLREGLTDQDYLQIWELIGFQEYCTFYNSLPTESRIDMIQNKNLKKYSADFKLKYPSAKIYSQTYFDSIKLSYYKNSNLFIGGGAVLLSGILYFMTKKGKRK